MKKIFLLIGPKGSGKSFIGTLIQENFDIPFICVEDWAKKVKNDRDITNELYRVEAFATIENGIREFLEEHDTVVFESIGLTHQFDTMYESLQEDFHVVTIGLNVENELCLKRFKSRDKSIHINVSDEKINMINNEFVKKNMQTNYTIDNNDKTEEQLIEELKEIIK